MKPDLQLIQRCARFSQLAYQAAPIIEGMVVELFGCKETDTEGFIAWNADEVFVVFRGTESIRDWLTDVDCKLDVHGRHSGFEQAISSVWPSLNHQLLFLHTEKLKPRQVIFTGHSLGGALAMLAQLHWALPATVITFGQPRVGGDPFCAAYDHFFGETTLRVVNDTDIVPRLPFALWLFGKYRHAGYTEYFLDTCGCPRINPPLWWKLLSDLASAYFDFRQRKLGLVGDHRMSDYLTALHNVRDTANIGTEGNSPQHVSGDTPIPPFSPNQGNH